MLWWMLGACLLTGPKDVEGDQPGECSDGADNDRDGDYDCDDEDCFTAPDCTDTDTDTDTDTETGTGTDTNTDTDTDDTGTPTPGDCPWVGSWALTAIECGSFTYDDWYLNHDGAELVIGHAAEEGCDVQLTVTGTTCLETEDWHLSTPSGTVVDLTSRGIVDCQPAQCTFGASDAPCQVGDRADGVVGITLVEVGGDIQLVGPLAESAPGCVLDVVTTWAAGS